jgi:hypothetical protein
MQLVDATVTSVCLHSDHAQYINGSCFVERWPHVNALTIRNSEHSYKEFNSELVLFLTSQAGSWPRLTCVRVLDELYLSTFATLTLALPLLEELLLVQPFMEYTGTSSYSNMSSMFKMDAARNILCLTSLGRLSRLRRLTLYWNVDSAVITQVATMSHMEELQISSMSEDVTFEAEDFERLAWLSNLRSLKLTHVSLETGCSFQALSSLTRLQSLHLSYQFFVHDACFESLSLLTTLTSLSVPHVNSSRDTFTPTRLSTLTNLVELNLHAVLDSRMQVP